MTGLPRPGDVVGDRGGQPLARRLRLAPLTLLGRVLMMSSGVRGTGTAS